MKLHKNQKLTVCGKEVTVRDLLGEGGQGEVYLINDGTSDLALKIYKEYPHPDFCFNLKNNIERGAPAESFLWPQTILDDGNLFGYTMSLRPKSFVPFVSYLNGKEKFKNQSAMLNWCIELCVSFKKLHEMGYSYQDLNDGSFFFDPDTGELLICDNDNVTANKKSLGILGKMRYMAPEIVRGDLDKKTGERQMPDVHSDRFSLAVILFMTLCLGNPYEGERLKEYPIVDEDAEFDLYGKNPVFVYHKADTSNRPIRGYHTSLLRRWPLLPLYVKEAFHRTFVDGLCDRENGRTTELEWLKLLCRYQDELVTCHCGFGYAYGLWDKQKRQECPLCKSPRAGGVSLLHVGKSKIILEPGKRLCSSHVDKYSPLYNDEIARVIRNKKDPSLWGIKLSYGLSAEVKDASGAKRDIPSGGVIPIVKDLEIKFNGGAIGKITEEA